MIGMPCWTALCTGEKKSPGTVKYRGLNPPIEGVEETKSANEQAIRIHVILRQMPRPCTAESRQGAVSGHLLLLTTPTNRGLSRIRYAWSYAICVRQHTLPQ